MSLTLLSGRGLEPPTQGLQHCQAADQLQEGGFPVAADAPKHVSGSVKQFARNTSARMTTAKTPLGFFLFYFDPVPVAAPNTAFLACHIFRQLPLPSSWPSPSSSGYPVGLGLTCLCAAELPASPKRLPGCVLRL